MKLHLQYIEEHWATTVSMADLGEDALSTQDIQDKLRLTKLYSEHAPDKLDLIDGILAKRPSDADRSKMWGVLREKYPTFFSKEEF